MNGRQTGTCLVLVGLALAGGLALGLLCGSDPATREARERESRRRHTAASPAAPLSNALQDDFPDRDTARTPGASASSRPVPSVNYAAAEHGAVASGGSRPQLLIDGNDTHYDGGEGFASTHWQAEQPESFLVTLKDTVPLNTVRFRLWDKDNRFYRYKLEASPEPEGNKWELLADRSAPPCEYRGWQVVSFDSRPVRRLRLTGTHNSANSEFHVVEIQAYALPPGTPPPWEGQEF